MSSWPGIQSIADDVNGGKLTAAQNVEKSLRIIEARQEFQAIISVVSERARQRAAEIDKQVKSGQSAGRLAGVPFIAKDNFLTLGGETTAASNMLRGFKAPYQATAIERLEAEGAICVAKANLDAFAHGSSTENSDFFVTKNPHDKSRVPGGSSGGSAASIVLEMAPFALGTDTGGSIRLPAAFCGAVGYKPTYGLVSRSGVIAMASSTDVIGPLTMNVNDAGLVLDVMAGRDDLDGTTIDHGDDLFPLSGENLNGKTIGLIDEYMGNGLSAPVRRSVLSAVESIKAAGATVKTVSLPSLPLALACYYIIMPAEVSSNLSRYDGQRFGFSSPDAKTLDESFTSSRSQGFGAEAKRRIMLGTYVLSSGYYDAYYKKAQQLRTKLIKEFENVFQTYDILIGPTAPTAAFKIGANVNNPLEMYLTDIMTVAANLVGCPAISLPCGTDGGLPIGLQLMAPQRHDRQLLEIAKTVTEAL